MKSMLYAYTSGTGITVSEIFFFAQTSWAACMDDTLELESADGGMLTMVRKRSHTALMHMLTDSLFDRLSGAFYVRFFHL